MASQKLVQDAFAEDVPDVTRCIEQQLQCGPDGDEAVMGPVSSDKARSNQVSLVWMHNPNGVDEVLVVELGTEVDRAGSKAEALLFFSCDYVGPTGRGQHGASTVVARSSSAETGVESGTETIWWTPS